MVHLVLNYAKLWILQIRPCLKTKDVLLENLPTYMGFCSFYVSNKLHDCQM